MRWARPVPRCPACRPRTSWPCGPASPTRPRSSPRASTSRPGGRSSSRPCCAYASKQRRCRSTAPAWPSPRKPTRLRRRLSCLPHHVEAALQSDALPHPASADGSPADLSPTRSPPPAQGPGDLGCLVVPGDEIHAATRVAERHTTRPHAFTSLGLGHSASSPRARTCARALTGECPRSPQPRSGSCCGRRAQVTVIRRTPPLTGRE